MKLTKLTSVHFSKKSPFKGKWVICVQFVPKRKYLASHDLPYSKIFIIMGYDRKTIVALVNFQTKGEFEPNLFQIHSTLYIMICHRVFKF